MNTDESRLELIEHFLSNNLTATEMEEVRKKIESDPEFAREVEWMKNFQSAMNNAGAFHLLEQFQEINTKRKRIKRLGKMVGIPLAVLLLFSILFFSGIFSSGGANTAPPQKSSQGPVAGAPVPENDIKSRIEFREGLQLLGDPDNEQRQQALRLLEDGRRLEALPLLESYLSTLPADDDDYKLRLETGKIYLSENDLQKAESHFEKVMQSDALPGFRSEARYYLAMALFAAGNKDRSRSLLNDLSENGTDNWKIKAAEFLSDAF